MALATTLSRKANVAVRSARAHQARGARFAASMVPHRGRAGCTPPQAFFITRRGSCAPSSAYNRASLPGFYGLGLGDLLDSTLSAADWLARSTSTHPMELRTNEASYELQADCPGMGEEDVNVEISPERVLTISGSRKAARRASAAHTPAAAAPQGAADGEAAAAPEASSAEDQDPAATSSYSYRFTRSFLLPDDAEAEAVQAALDRGVLTVTIPRRAIEKPKPRRISIKGSADGKGQEEQQQQQ